MRNAEFNHPRLVEVYDAECRWSRDDDFFLEFVNEQSSSMVLDLGCGTGRLTLGLAGAGHTVTGVDPAAASLAAAMAKSGADRVTWIEGTSAVLPAGVFDTALMTSHVAQFLITDAAFEHTLEDLAQTLLPGGRLAFDSRDPVERAWDRWNPPASERRCALDGGLEVHVWTEVQDVRSGVVDFTHHYRFSDGEVLQSRATLRFRTEPELRRSLRNAGFHVDAIYGGWNQEPVGEGDGEFIVVARSEGVQ